MAQIVPAILEKTKADFAEKVTRIVKLPGLDRIQVDFGDGIFVPNTILPVSEMEPLNPAFHWEAHLMVQEPKDFLDYKICGFKTIIVHYEAYPNAEALKGALTAIKEMGAEPGVCLKNETPVSALKELEGEARHFQLMGIVPGFQGASFIENTYDRIKELRQLMPSAVIEVDGGINLTNIRQVAQAGADLVTCGSALVKAPNIVEAYEKLSAEINRI